jgi:hypothetical protein
VKLVVEFRLRKSFVTGEHYRGRVCKRCHQDTANARKQNSYPARKKARDATARWRENNPEKHRQLALHYARMRKFGITLAERDELLAAQGNVCAICQGDNSGSKRDWHIDHCHKSNQIRGILCHPCNLLLGFAKEDTHVLERAISYIKAHESD